MEEPALDRSQRSSVSVVGADGSIGPGFGLVCPDPPPLGWPSAMAGAYQPAPAGVVAPSCPARRLSTPAPSQASWSEWPAEGPPNGSARRSDVVAGRTAVPAGDVARPGRLARGGVPGRRTDPGDGPPATPQVVIGGTSWLLARTAAGRLLWMIRTLPSGRRAWLIYVRRWMATSG